MVGFAQARAIAVDGAVVYAGGWHVQVIGHTAKPCYWANGNLTILKALDELGGGGVWAITSNVPGRLGSIFMVGSSESPSGYSEPCYWGHAGNVAWEGISKAHAFSHKGYGGAAYDVTRTESQIVACGFVDDAEGKNISCYWSGGERIALDMGDGINGHASKVVAASGGEVYVFGTYYTLPDNNEDPPKTVPCVWKNGVRTDLPMPAGWAGDAAGIITTPTSGAVFDGDVYAAKGNGGALCYWKNGEYVEYEEAFANAFDIVVKR